MPDGSYTVYVYQTNYLPTTADATLTGGVGSATACQQGSLVETSLTSTRLTEQQIVAAGIDPTTQPTKTSYKFTIDLYFGPTPITLSGYTTAGGGGGAGFVGGTTYGGGGGGGGGGVCSGTCPIPPPGGAGPSHRLNIPAANRSSAVDHSGSSGISEGVLDVQLVVAIGEFGLHTQ